MGGWHLSHVARKFERLLETYRREDGSKWSGIELERATGGVVTRSYVTNLRKRGIENPGMNKLWALASRRWVSPALWFEEAAKSRCKRQARSAGWPAVPIGDNPSVVHEVLSRGLAQGRPRFSRESRRGSSG